eukprot:2966172-Rhodomonas_salina.1
MEGEEFEESPVRSHALENSEMEGEEFEESIVRSHALESSEDQDLESTLVGQFEGEALSVAKDLRDRRACSFVLTEFLLTSCSVAVTSRLLDFELGEDLIFDAVLEVANAVNDLITQRETLVKGFSELDERFNKAAQELFDTQLLAAKRDMAEEARDAIEKDLEAQKALVSELKKKIREKDEEIGYLAERDWEKNENSESDFADGDLPMPGLDDSEASAKQSSKSGPSQSKTEEDESKAAEKRKEESEKFSTEVERLTEELSKTAEQRVELEQQCATAEERANKESARAEQEALLKAHEEDRAKLLEEEIAKVREEIARLAEEAEQERARADASDRGLTELQARLDLAESKASDAGAARLEMEAARLEMEAERQRLEAE